jgi:hypothetical protein
MNGEPEFAFRKYVCYLERAVRVMESVHASSEFYNDAEFIAFFAFPRLKTCWRIFAKVNHKLSYESGNAVYSFAYRILNARHVSERLQKLAERVLGEELSAIRQEIGTEEPDVEVDE